MLYQCSYVKWMNVQLLVLACISFIVTAQNNIAMANIVIYARDVDTPHRIHSMTDIALNQYHRELTNAMDNHCEALRELPNVTALYNVWNDLKQNIQRIPELWAHNEDTLRLLLSPRVPITLGMLNSPAITYLEHSAEPTSYNSIHQVFVHLTRDWAHNTPIYSRILAHVRSYIACDTQAKVLVPGAGLGRLALEIATTGCRQDNT